MIAYAVTIFLSAFLLFQVQPIIAKIILPWFGGTAAVWTTCMLFFQMELLLGYLYAHFSIRHLPPRRQAWIHTALLAASLLLLPILPSAYWKPEGTENPSLRIIVLLAASVGLPYFLLSTTSPLVQAWYSRAGKGAIPYRLFALSNLGSMLALLSYPALIEPFLPTRMQGLIWSGAFAVFAALCATTAIRSSAHAVAREAGEADRGAEPVAPVSVGRHILWVALAACPSILLLAVTNHLTQDVAAIPFLWILPLTLYLLTFILCFDAEGWYQREMFLVVLVPALAGMAYLLTSSEGVSVKITLAAFAAAFFICCMVCHGELARLKPDPRHLTAFYLMISIGGAMGGLFVGIVAPYFFVSYFEFPIAVALVAVLVFIVLTLDREARFHTAWLSPQFILALSVVLSLSIYLARAEREDVHNYKVVQRNFYGTLRVRAVGNMDDWDGFRTLLHGNINHGEQWTHPDRRRDPITYYCRSSGVGRAMEARLEGKPNRVGILGLGAGTLVTFGRPGDYYRVYEINPLVPALARKEFSYVPDSRAKVEVVMGDARLSMEREPPQNFDMLIMDAFSGDSVPVHLITREAFALYFRHLQPDGVLAVHISNKYLNLEPVIQRLVETYQKAGLIIEDEEDDEGTCFGTTWVLVTANQEYFKQAPFHGLGRPLEPKAGVPVWTDDYSNMFRILR